MFLVRLPEVKRSPCQIWETGDLTTPPLFTKFQLKKNCYRLKGTKKDDQYKLLWSELEVLIQSSGDTPQHKAILQCLQECRSKGVEPAAKSDSESSRKLG